MTRAQTLAQNLRQLVVLLWIVGAIATFGFFWLIILEATDERATTFGLTVRVVEVVLLWIGLGWMGAIASGIAELLAPTAPPAP